MHSQLPVGFSLQPQVFGIVACFTEAVFAVRWYRGIGVAGQQCWTSLQTCALLRTLAVLWTRNSMEAWLGPALVAPFLLPSFGVHPGKPLRVLCSLVNLAVLCPSRCVGLLLLWESLRPTYGPKAFESTNHEHDRCNVDCEFKHTQAFEHQTSEQV